MWESRSIALRAWLVLLALPLTAAAQDSSARDVDRSSPRRAVFGYIDACRAGDYATAARYLDLHHLPPQERAVLGPRLSHRLKLVLDRRLWIDRDAVSDDPRGQLDDELPSDQDRLGAISLAGGSQGIRVVLVSLPEGGQGWLFSSSTVHSIDALYAEHGYGWLGEHLPQWLRAAAVLEFQLWQLLALALIVPLAYLGGRLLAPLLTGTLAGIAARTETEWDERLVAAARRPLRLFLTAALAAAGAETLGLAVPAQEVVSTAVRTATLVALGVFARGALTVIGAVLEHRLAGPEAEPVQRRAAATQIDVFERIAAFATALLVSALILAQFDVMRTVGLSLLASAGVAGIAISFAAQRSIANLFAGLQILVTQPIRIDDVVIVEGEWGTIEEINLTHVVVKIWDLRRLVVPITYFLERPFQNWTRVSPELLGTIYFYTDHTVDLAAMRAELDRVLAETDLWDGKVKGIVVTAIKDHVVEVRALISAADAGRHWELRCLVRERLLTWLQERTSSLPTVRIDAPRGLPASAPSGEPRQD